MSNKIKKIPTLLLNADYVPLKTITWRKAMRLLYKGVVIPVEYYDETDVMRGDVSTASILDSKGRHHPVPSVIVLKKWVRQTFTVKYNSKNVYLRDKMTCQYCGKKFPPKFLTKDHVIPRSRYKNKDKQTCWENIVTCCIDCNRKKGNKLCEEVKMFPLKKPVEPKYHEILPGILKYNMQTPSKWQIYLKVLNTKK